jgi:hypothetical protein
MPFLSSPNVRTTPITKTSSWELKSGLPVGLGRPGNPDFSLKKRPDVNKSGPDVNKSGPDFYKRSRFRNNHLLGRQPLLWLSAVRTELKLAKFHEIGVPRDWRSTRLAFHELAFHEMSFHDYNVPRGGIPRDVGFLNSTSCRSTSCRSTSCRSTRYRDTIYTNIFHCKTHKNLPKSGFLVWKYAIWQSLAGSCLASKTTSR